MRVSDSMFTDLATTNLTARRAETYEAQRVAQTGLRVGKPSDDPVAAASARSTRSTERRAETVMKTSGEALDRLNAVDGALNDVATMWGRVQEIAVQGANDHLSPDDRNSLAVEVSVLRSQLLSLSNTRFEGEYVFGGLAVDRPPYDATGAFNGESTLRELEIGPGVRVSTQISGGDAFGGTSGVNAFAALDQLEASLRANDGPAVHSMLDDISSVASQVADARAAGGAAQQGLIQAQAAAARLRDEAIRRRADLTEADPVEAFTELVRAQGALRDALSIAQQLPPPSLLGSGG